MWSIPKIWEDGRCFIIGGGPSMPRQFDVPEEVIQSVYAGRLTPEAYSPYLSSLHKEHVIAVNMAYQLGPWIDVLFFGDDGYWTNNKAKILAFPGLRITCAKNIEWMYQRRVKVMTRDPRKTSGISDSPKTVSWNKNSGGAAISVAAHFGVKQIILLGFDMKLDEGKNQHWHKFYGGNPKTVGATFKIHKRGFPAIAEDAKRMGIEILNANPDSNIEEFKKIKIKDILL